MEVRPGYKQTEVGVIPDDWELESLEQFSAFITKGSTPTTYGFKWELHGVLFLRSECVSENGLDLSQSMYISPAAHSALRRSQVRDGDLLMTITGNVGRVVFLAGVGTANLNQHIARVRVDRTNVDAHFVYHFLSQHSVRNRFGSITTGQAYPQISLKQVREAQVPLPPTQTEQEAIADALSDADALIESLEQLLVKKRQLKQGAMQELLTGKKRLPGFSGEWEVRRLDELGRWTGGMTPSMRNPDYWQAGAVPWISSGDVKSVRLNSTAFAISEYAVKQRAATLLPAKSIIVVTRSGILRKYLPVAMNMIPMAINQDIKALLPNDHVLPEYVLHSLTCIGDRILARCLKSGTTVESIEFPWLKAFTIPIPPLPEQTAIAAIFSDMDAEIATLEAKLVKARQLKQGMMQELLTGRIRLV